ncbi:MAG: ABC transporter substrate-binding protein, partial [Desulfobacter sp.]
MNQGRYIEVIFRRILFAVWVILFLCLLIGMSGCSSDPPPNAPSCEPPSNAGLSPLVYQKLPDNIRWITNDTDPVFASDNAEKGGMVREAIMDFPMTFRVVGPDSNGSFRSAILDNQLSLINI